MASNCKKEKKERGLYAEGMIVIFQFNMSKESGREFTTSTSSRVGEAGKTDTWHGCIHLHDSQLGDGCCRLAMWSLLHALPHASRFLFAGLCTGRWVSLCKAAQWPCLRTRTLEAASLARKPARCLFGRRFADRRSPRRTSNLGRLIHFSSPDALLMISIPSS